MARKSISPTVQADVVIKSRRRCALCVGIDGNSNERPGQIAHLNGDQEIKQGSRSNLNNTDFSTKVNK